MNPEVLGKFQLSILFNTTLFVDCCVYLFEQMFYKLSRATLLPTNSNMLRKRQTVPQIRKP